MEQCFVPSQIMGRHPAVAAFGEVVELLIRADYCRTKGGCQEYLTLTWPTPPGQTDFFDVAMGFSRCRHLASYLKLHNPHVDEVRVAGQCELKKERGKHFPVPDIITHEPPTRVEFYEIKPNSRAGKRDGTNKIVWFELICHDEGLPYVAGTQYSSSRRLVVWNATWFGVPAKVRLHWFLDKPGLLVYELCVEVSQETVAEAIVKSLVKLAILALIVMLLNPAGAAAAAAAVLASVTSPLRQPVGREGANESSDVAYAQLLLGDWRTRNGLPPLVVDGICGPRTTEAILGFQRSATGIADGRLDPDMRGIRTLEREQAVAGAAGALVAFQETGPVVAPEPWEVTSEPPDEEVEPASPVTPVEIDVAVRDGFQSYLDGLYLAAGEMVG